MNTLDRPVTQSEYQALAAFRHAIRQFLRFSEAAAEAVGLTPRQYQALLAIKGVPPGQRPTIGDLAGQLQVHHHSAVGLVDRLVAHGLVVRRAAPEDRRRVQLALTARGERMLRRLATAHRAELRQIGPRLGSLLARLGPRRR
jgi:DNA-binding MarR family transcriptional regulator